MFAFLRQHNQRTKSRQLTAGSLFVLQVIPFARMTYTIGLLLLHAAEVAAVTGVNLDEVALVDELHF